MLFIFCATVLHVQYYQLVAQCFYCY